MDAVTTSLAQGDSLRGQWSAFGAFLRRPRVPERAPPPSLAALAAVWRLLLLDVILMIVLVGAVALAERGGIALPETAIAGMTLTGPLIALVVLGAPLAEEIIFRGWLSGRPGHVLATLAIALGGAVGTALAIGPGAPAQKLAGLAIAGGGLLVAAALLYLLRGRGPMRWFAAIFPALFALATLGFAGVHLLNYKDPLAAQTLPLVVPQLIAGAIFGYARVTYGLWSSVLLHMLHNGAFVGLVLLATRVAG